MSYDDRCLVDLINKRFDDTLANISALKADMLRETENLRGRIKEVETQDQAQHAELKTDVDSLKNVKWMLTGAASAAVVIAQVLFKLIERFI